MTALNFYLNENEVAISMDTLSIDINGNPYKYASKIFHLPHLRSVMCGTGNLEVILNWFLMIQKNIISKDIDYLSDNTSSQLKEINEKVLSSELTSTIYQFGYSTMDKCFKGFVYRSTSDFERECLPYCIAMKPEVEFSFREQIEVVGIDNAFIELMTKQKEIDDNSGKDRIGIGGEIHRLYMTKDSSRLDIIHQFPDYEVTYEQIMTNLKSNKN